MNIFTGIKNFFTSLFANSPADKLLPTAHMPSPVDYRDVQAADVLTGVPTRPPVVTCPYPLVVKNQFLPIYIPNCVGQAGSTMEEYELKKNGIASIELDGEDLYQQCKLIDGIPNVQGTYFRAVLKVLKNTGAKAVGDTSGKRYKITGYAQVNPDAESIKQAIWQWGTVLMAFNIYSNGSWNTAYIQIPQGSTIAASHATVGKGYDQNFITGQNCWGLGWGDKGNFYVPPGYLPYEVWAITDVPPALLPDPTQKPSYTFNYDMYYGLDNADIKVLQDCLKYFGCMSKAIPSTAYFGKDTLAATKLFQQHYGLPHTGYFGALSRSQMNMLLK